MKISLLLAAFIFSGAASAETACPAYFPTTPILLAEGQGGRTVVRVEISPLTNAFLASGQMGAEQTLVPDIRKRSDGFDIGYNFSTNEARWLVCVYGGMATGSTVVGVGGNLTRWSRLPSNGTDCLLRTTLTTSTTGQVPDFRASVSCH